MTPANTVLEDARGVCSPGRRISTAAGRVTRRNQVVWRPHRDSNCTEPANHNRDDPRQSFMRGEFRVVRWGVLSTRVVAVRRDLTPIGERAHRPEIAKQIE